MGGILNVVGKGQQLFIVVEKRGKQLHDHDAGQAGRPGTQQGQTFSAVAIGTGIKAHLAIAPLHPGIGHVDQNQFRMVAGRTAVRLRQPGHPQALGTEVIEIITNRSFPVAGFLGKEIDNFRIMAEKSLVEILQISHDRRIILAFQTGPAHAAAFPAVHQWQVNPQLLLIKVIGKPKPGAAAHLPNHAPQLPQPELYPDIQKRPVFSRFTAIFTMTDHLDPGIGNQGEKAAQHFQPKIFRRLPQPPGDIFQTAEDIIKADRFTPQHLQQVLKEKMTLEPFSQLHPPFLVVKLTGRLTSEPQPVLGANITFVVGEIDRVQISFPLRQHDVNLGHQPVTQEFPGAQAGLGNDRVGGKPLSENRRGILQQSRVIVTAA